MRLLEKNIHDPEYVRAYVEGFEADYKSLLLSKTNRLFIERIASLFIGLAMFVGGFIWGASL